MIFKKNIKMLFFLSLLFLTSPVKVYSFNIPSILTSLMNNFFGINIKNKKKETFSRKKEIRKNIQRFLKTVLKISLEKKASTSDNILDNYFDFLQTHEPQNAKKAITDEINSLEDKKYCLNEHIKKNGPNNYTSTFLPNILPYVLGGIFLKNTLQDYYANQSNPMDIGILLGINFGIQGYFSYTAYKKGKNFKQRKLQKLGSKISALKKSAENHNLYLTTNKLKEN